MNCDAIRLELTARRTGDLDPRFTDEVDAHLRDCRSCAAEARSEASLLSLLKPIEEITPSPNVWQRLERETRNRRLTLTGPLKIAAAAGILAAAFSFAFVAVAYLRPARVATVASVAPGSPIEPGYALRVNERLASPNFALLSLPDIGTLKLNRDTSIVFTSPRSVRLERGELFASIRPDVRGFTVSSGGTEVAVHGTRFGVRSGDVSSASARGFGAMLVYVIDGQVEVKSPQGRVTLTGHQMADGAAVRPLDDDALRWLARLETPVVALEAKAPFTRLKKGDALDLGVTFLTGSAAPVLLPPLDELLPLLRLNVTDAAGNSYLVRVPSTALRNAACRTRGAHGPVRLDVSTPCILSLRIAPDLLPSSGAYKIRAAFQPAASRDSSIPPKPLQGAKADEWDRELESETLEIQVQ